MRWVLVTCIGLRVAYERHFKSRTRGSRRNWLQFPRDATPLSRAPSPIGLSGCVTWPSHPQVELTGRQ